MSIPSDAVLIDTCVWASFFTKPSSEEKKAIDLLIDENRSALLSPIFTEVLMGIRRDSEADWVASRLALLHRPEVTLDDWKEAGRQGAKLRGRGHKLPLVDLVIAATAIRLDLAIYTTDPHFDLFSDLKRYQP